jgi:kumamolisin
VRQISAGEVYQRGASSPGVGASAAQGCQGAVKTGAFTPNQLSTAYGVDELRSRGLDGSGVRVATLSSQEVDAAGFRTWAQCFGLRAPAVRQFAMPGATRDTGTAPEETVLDVEALASLAPGLQRITPIFVPLDQSFSNSFLVFMFGALDPSRHGGRLPHILSVSDGVCESRFTRDQLQLGRRLLIQAAALGITTLAASGDLGFRGCFINRPGAMFPSSSPFTTSVGGTDLTLTAGNEIADQVVWSTFATQPDQGVGSGGGPSKAWRRPGFQQAPGIGPQLQQGDPTRLSPDIAAMASFTPGIATFDKDGGGWGIGGGTSAATPLTAAIVALALQQERQAGRPRLGSLPPLLYQLARGPGYNSIFSDITSGTSSRRPNSAVGKTPAGGAAQPGYDLATGLGSLKAAAFAEAVASQQPPPTP